MLNQVRRATHEPRLEHRVKSLLAAAAAPSEPGPLTGEAEVLAAFRAARDLPRRSARLSARTPLRAIAAVFVSTGLLLAGTVAATATGSLPGPAEHTVHEWLTRFGAIAPANERPSTPAPAPPGAGAVRHAPRTSDNGVAASDQARQGHANQGRAKGAAKGASVPDLPRRSHGNGASKGKGACVSELASDGQSRAGDKGAEKRVAEDHKVDERSGRPNRRADGRQRLAACSAAH
jgi:hypothetical protein